jgi:hypothetical protein
VGGMVPDQDQRPAQGLLELLSMSQELVAHFHFLQEEVLKNWLLQEVFHFAPCQ